MTNSNLTTSCILIVDDQQANVDLLEQILRFNGYDNLVTTVDPRRVLAIREEFDPDLVLLDLHMPQMSGFELLERLTAAASLFLPILVLTGDITRETKAKALASGAKDFVGKPFDTVEVLLRIRNLLETRALYKELKHQNEGLEQRVKERTYDLEQAQMEILDRLALASEYRDDATGLHTKRVGNLSALIARELGQSEEQVELLRLAAPLHDVGKIGVPDHIFLKAGKLTPGEMGMMQSHVEVGGEILSKSRFPVLNLAREIVLYHHERWDGCGYPQRLHGEAIPLCGRIVALADVFDALTHERPYKKAWSFEESITEIRSQTGRHFDPQVAQAFLSVVSRVTAKRLVAAIGTNSDMSLLAPV